MHRGLSSVMIDYARSISDERKQKLSLRETNQGKLRGVVMTNSSRYKCRFKKTRSLGRKFKVVVY